MQVNALKDGMVDVDGSILAEVEVDVGNIWGWRGHALRGNAKSASWGNLFDSGARTEAASLVCLLTEGGVARQGQATLAFWGGHLMIDRMQ
jgi:hypothetical protein